MLYPIYLFLVTPSPAYKILRKKKSSCHKHRSLERSYYIEQHMKREEANCHFSFLPSNIYCFLPLPERVQFPGRAAYKQIPAWNKIRFSARWKKDIDSRRNPRACPIIFTNPKPPHKRHTDTRPPPEYSGCLVIRTPGMRIFYLAACHMNSCYRVRNSLSPFSWCNENTALRNGQTLKFGRIIDISLRILNQKMLERASSFLIFIKRKNGILNNEKVWKLEGRGFEGLILSRRQPRGYDICPCV